MKKSARHKSEGSEKGNHFNISENPQNPLIVIQISYMDIEGKGMGGMKVDLSDGVNGDITKELLYGNERLFKVDRSDKENRLLKYKFGN